MRVGRPLPLDDEGPGRMGEMKDQHERIRGRRESPEPIPYASPRVEKVLSPSELELEVLYAGDTQSPLT